VPPARGERVVAVVVTRTAELLRQSLGRWPCRPGRSTPWWSDNGPDRPGEVVRASGLPHTYLPRRPTSAGPAASPSGMLTALAEGADWVWCADDDGRPADEHVLATLLSVARERGLAEVSPAVADIDAPGSFAFPLRRGLRWKGRARPLGGEDFCPATPRCSTARCSPRRRSRRRRPGLRLFARGDETEIHRRLVRAGLPFGTALDAPTCTPTAATSSSRSSAGGCPRSTPSGVEALLHLPQPRVPDAPARDALAVPAGAGPLLLVLPGDPARRARVPRVAAPAARRPPRAVHPRA
jgi:rhamnopyranosyl-N-acetylglucosaminyl-diphospho-decaprenol beta-1,3/1,4-galactofuranosyltransferase